MSTPIRSQRGAFYLLVFSLSSGLTLHFCSLSYSADLKPNKFLECINLNLGFTHYSRKSLEPGQPLDSSWYQYQKSQEFRGLQEIAHVEVDEVVKNLVPGDVIEFAEAVKVRARSGGVDTLRGAERRLLVEKASDQSGGRTLVLRDLNSGQRLFIKKEQLVNELSEGKGYLQKAVRATEEEKQNDSAVMKMLDLLPAEKRALSREDVQFASDAGFHFLPDAARGNQASRVAAIYDSLNYGDQILLKDRSSGKLLQLEAADWKYGVRVFRNPVTKENRLLTPSELAELGVPEGFLYKRNPNPPKDVPFDPRVGSAVAQVDEAMRTFAQDGGHQIQRDFDAGRLGEVEAGLRAGQIAMLEAKHRTHVMELQNIKALRGMTYRRPYVKDRILLQSIPQNENHVPDFSSLSGKKLKFTLHGTPGASKETRTLTVSQKGEDVRLVIPIKDANEGKKVYAELLESAYGQLLDNYPAVAVVDHRINTKVPPRVISSDGTPVIESGLASGWRLLFKGEYESTKGENNLVITFKRGKTYRDRDLIDGLIWGHDLRQ